jgi:predicted phage terminase large subunit-like protein
MTRWSLRDLTGQVIKSSAARGGDEWEVIEFPAILPSGNPLWPEFWSLNELEALRTELPNGKWMAQYQQQPTSDSSAIIKREWWKVWEKEDPPQCDYVLQTWDTAFEKNTRADYSACTTWGIFYNDEDHGLPNIILLNSFKARMEWVELKETAFRHYQEWEPDSILIEKKATGAPLIYEFRSMGIPAQEFTPGKGNDKISRLNAVSDIIASGKVWVPETRWAEELVDEIASFPSGEHDDLVDATTLALARFRQGGFIRLPSDEPEDIKWFKGRQGQDKYYNV